MSTENCRFCWMCRHVCPVGFVTSRETLTPHAWALTIESVKRGQLTWNPETADVMFACADCGLCRSHCVTDQPLPDAIADARADIVKRGVAPAAVAEIDRKLRTYANPYSTEMPSPRRADLSGPPRPGLRDPADVRVALFVGDTGHHLGAKSVDAAIALLQAVGTDVMPICRGRSSGLLASTLGLKDTAEALGRAMLEEVEASGARELLVLGPADRWTFEYVYPRRLGISWPSAVIVREVTDVLADALAEGRLKLDPLKERSPYAYHDPCHSSRVAPDRPAPRALLAAALGAESGRDLFWRGHRAHPCGAVGGLEFTTPDIARRLALARLGDASSVGARVLVTEDPACCAHLGAHARPEIAVIRLYELLADRLLR
jgi:Fe-S oxidoreductase